MPTEVWSSEQGREYFRSGKAPPRPVPARKQPLSASRMNQTEAEYLRLYLQPRLIDGLALEVRYESMTLFLADRCWYKPDFVLIAHEGIEIHEVKGAHAWEDARVKWKAAAEVYWWLRFFWAQKAEGNWKIEEYGECQG